MNGRELLAALDQAGATVANEEGGLVVTWAANVPVESLEAEVASGLDGLCSAWCQREWRRHCDERLLPMQDPRLDLTEDSAWWNTILHDCYYGNQELQELCGTLAGLRACGARLVKKGEQVTLTPGGFSVRFTAEDYQEARTLYLVPHGQALRGLLGRVGRGAEE